jgi:CRP/FNR family transcriptional regulator, cyclic AMP receptor protein
LKGVVSSVFTGALHYMFRSEGVWLSGCTFEFMGRVMSSRSDIGGWLREQSLLRTSDEVVIDRVKAMVRVEEVARGDYVSVQGDPNSPLVFLFSGQLQSIILTKDGLEIPVHMIHAGDSAGAPAILNGVPNGKSILALERSVVAVVNRSDARRLFLEPAVARALGEQLASRIHDVVAGYSVRGAPRSTTRVCAIIYELFRQSGEDTSRPFEIPIHSAVAVAAQVSRETVTRVLSMLSRHEIILKSRSRLWVTNPAALRALACS